MESKKVKVHYGIIAGGRAGTDYKSGSFEVDTYISEDDFEDLLDRLQDSIGHNDDNSIILEAIKKGKMIVYDDIFGEGVVGSSIPIHVLNS